MRLPPRVFVVFAGIDDEAERVVGVAATLTKAQEHAQRLCDHPLDIFLRLGAPVASYPLRWRQVYRQRAWRAGTRNAHDQDKRQVTDWFIIREVEVQR